MYPDQGLPRPDIVFQLDVDVEKAELRGDYGKEKYEKVEFQKKIQKEFERFHKYWYWRLVKAGGSDKQEIQNNITEHIQKLLQSYNANELDDLKKNFYPNSIGEDLFLYADI